MWLISFGGARPVAGQALQQRLIAEDPAMLARDARQQGDAQRGAIVFFQPYLACTTCHVAGPGQRPIGPDLAGVAAELAGRTEAERDAHLVEAVLQPSKRIRQGYESATVITAAGRTLTGLVVEDTPERLVLRDAARGFQPVTIPRGKIEQRSAASLSIMPDGQLNALASRQQFLDLLRYLMEIRDGGP
ncbi:MAG: heme-binding protein, partial [Pirellulaceae bacterium]|nr:heme-binding protein [Pirellulaceae bacterium]